MQTYVLVSMVVTLLVIACVFFMPIHDELENVNMHRHEDRERNE